MLREDSDSSREMVEGTLYLSVQCQLASSPEEGPSIVRRITKIRMVAVRDILETCSLNNDISAVHTEGLVPSLVPALAQSSTQSSISNRISSRGALEIIHQFFPKIKSQIHLMLRIETPR